MKGKDREVWLVLTQEINCGLDFCCKYSEHCSNGSICCEGETWLDNCTHPLEHKIADKFNWDESCEWPGYDCWGFRPSYKLQDFTDIVGIIISNNWNRWLVWEEEGQIYVYGVNREV